MLILMSRSGQGRSYVVFGGPGMGDNGLLALSSLNGANGFILDGENNDDSSGFPSARLEISMVMGSDLLIGAYGYPKGVLPGALTWCLAMHRRY